MQVSLYCIVKECAMRHTMFQKSCEGIKEARPPFLSLGILRFIQHHMES